MSDRGSVVVIGSGAAGRSCAKRLARAGWQVSIAEKDRWGGTCLWRGCIPKKSLYHSARVMRQARNAEQFGVRVTGVDADWQSMLAWKWHSQETFAGDQKGILLERKIETIEGTARFTAPDAVEVAGRTLRFDHAVIATGAEPVIPELPGVELCDTSDDALRYPAIPTSLLIVGGGFIAAELAAVFASVGTVVTVVTRSGFLGMLDDDLAAVAHRRLAQLGVRFRDHASLLGVERNGAGLSAAFRDDLGVETRLESERVLLAVGRRPSYADLDPAAANVAVDEHGRLVLDAFGRTSNPVVWACGDAAGGEMHTPVAGLEGLTVARSIDTGHPAHADCSAVPVTCFTDPQLATVGLSEKAAAEQGRDVEVVRITADLLGAAVIEDARDAFTKVVYDRSTRAVLGVQVAGPSASDVILSGALAVRMKVTAEQLAETIAVHPSFSEGVYYAGG